MKISSRGRYGLAAAIVMAQQHHRGENVTVISIAEKLGISKIYLEQAFSLLKRGGLVSSVKGAQGGYQLTRTPDLISLFDVLSSVESALFEQTGRTVAEKAPEIEKAMQISAFKALDTSVKDTLMNITLNDLVAESEKHKADIAPMFYI